MSDKYPGTSNYAYCRNNPIMLVDPDGMDDDWFKDKDGNVKWDPSVTSQDNTPNGGEYVGRTVKGVDARGETVYGDQYGKTHKSIPLKQVDIVDKQTEHQKTMSNSFVKGYHKGQNIFMKVALGIANKVLGNVGTALTTVGYGSMLVGTGPIGAAVAKLGVGLSNISLAIDSGLKINDGNYSGAAINLGTHGLGRAGEKGVKALGNKGLDASILNSGVDIKTDLINRGANHVNDEKRK